MGMVSSFRVKESAVDAAKCNESSAILRLTTVQERNPRKRGQIIRRLGEGAHQFRDILGVGY